MKKQQKLANILLIEGIGFGLLIILIWLDEILDFPHHFFNAPVTPINWDEAGFETGIICIVAGIILYITKLLLKRIKYLEGFYSICAKCKKVRVGERWVSLEEFLSQNSEIILSHGYCSTCYDEKIKEIENEHEHK